MSACRYNLGHHRLPSNKFLLYDHSLRIPMLFSGPGITAGVEHAFFGTQVDLAPTMLGMVSHRFCPLSSGE
jgi:arylsulfatase A-like enzyme